MNPEIDKRYKSLLVLWLGSFFSIGMFWVLSAFLSEPDETAPLESAQSSLVFAVLAAAAVITVAISLLVKRTLLQRSVDTQNVNLVQQALVMGVALTEVGAIAGVIDAVLINSGLNYVLFIIAAVGSLLHFPRRNHLLGATYKSSLDKAVQ